MGNLFLRPRNARLMRAIQAAPDEASALAIVGQSLEPRFDWLGGALGRDDGSRHRR